MFVRNRLTAGDFVTIVPIGLPATLQYDENGRIQRVFKGFVDSRIDISDKVFEKVLETKSVPRSVMIQGGTTWVSGVFYTDQEKSLVGSGDIPRSIEDDFLNRWMSGKIDVEFYAGSAKSLAYSFRGAQPTRSWLTFSKFNLLPGYVVPSDLDEDKFARMVDRIDTPFRYPRIQGFITYRYGNPVYQDMKLKQFTVTDIVMFVSISGHICSKIFNSSGFSIVVDYSDTVRYNVTKGASILLDEDYNIISSSPVKRVDNEISCPICGRRIIVPGAGQVSCPDDHCNSNLFLPLNRFLNTLGLPSWDKNRYDSEILKKIKTFSIPDIFDLPEYKEIKVKTNLSNLLSAIVPDRVADTHFLISLCNRCNNSVDSVEYYVSHPSRISSELGLKNTKLIDWLDKPENCMDVLSLLHNEHIVIVMRNKKFNGDPIFRGKTIAVTGIFNHGNFDEISAILSSYSASVTNKMSNAVGCVIVGDTKENIDGSMIQSAKMNNVPIMTESQFFSRYGIEDDLAENL